jgi:DNA polymerase III epsilon subunit-like protein
MIILFFDTETTGLPKNRYKKPEELSNNWPDIVQIAWILYDNETETRLEQNNYIIKPESWTIPQESVKYHGITQEMAMTTGNSLAEVMVLFKNAFDRADKIIAHNLNFDKSVVLASIYWRIGNKNINLWWPKEKIQFCTMEFDSKGKKGKYTFRSLDTIYSELFKEKYIGQHNAINDTVAVAKVYLKRWENKIFV